jgi:hypothetical protein
MELYGVTSVDIPQIGATSEKIRSFKILLGTENLEAPTELSLRLGLCHERESRGAGSVEATYL